MRLVSKNFSVKWKNYVWQSVGAGISILLLIRFTDIIGLVLVAAAGSTAFTVFGLPHNRTARARNVIGGTSICAVTGFACSHLNSICVAGGLAVGIASFLMVLFDAEHPPAAGAALGLAISPDLLGVAFAFVSACVFSTIRYLLADFLKDLY